MRILRRRGYGSVPVVRDRVAPSTPRRAQRRGPEPGVSAGDPAGQQHQPPLGQSWLWKASQKHSAASGSSASSDIATASTRSQPPGEVSTSNQASASSSAPVADAAMVSRRDRRSALSAVAHQPEQQPHVVAGPGHVVVLRQLVGGQGDGGDHDPRQQDHRAAEEHRGGPPDQPGVVGQHRVAQLVAGRHQLVQPVGHPVGGLHHGPDGSPGLRFGGVASRWNSRHGRGLGRIRTVVLFAELLGAI